MNEEEKKAYRREYYLLNKDKLQKQHKDYYEKNKEKLSIKKKEWHEKNKIKANENHKKYYQENKEKLKERYKDRSREYSKNYRLAHKDYFQEYNKKYKSTHKDYFNKKQKQYLQRHPEEKEKCLEKLNNFVNNLSKEDSNRISRDYNRKYPEKLKARNLVKKIKIPENQLCQICHEEPAKIKHHWRYDRPLMINFLGKSCHHIIHFKNKGLGV